MLATVVYERNPFYPGRDREVKQFRRRRRLDKLAPSTRQPFICRRNGLCVLRRDWKSTCVEDGDIVQFVVLPMGGGGGGGKNPLALVAMVALTIFAPGIGAGIAGELGLAGGFTLFGTEIAYSTLISGALKVVGGLLINSLFASKPQANSPQQTQSLAAPSPTYNLQAQGNIARLEQPIPAWFGYHQMFPDFGAEPYAEFVGNEQYLYSLLVIGQGEYEVHEIRIEDTLISSFEEITYEIVEPGGSVTLFPANVTNAVEVSGQEMETDVYLGPFTANAAGTAANALGLDMVCPRGLFYANSSGGMDAKTIDFNVEARLVDDAGDPLGDWVVLGEQSITGATATPQRVSYRYDVTPGRYEVRVKRTDTKDEDSRAGHTIAWAGLRAYLPGSQEYGAITLLAIRMRASNQLSSQSARRVNVIATRKLPTWSPGGGWTAPMATRSIAWAVAEACRADYGAELADSAIDLATLYTLDTVWTDRGDHFDFGFDQRLTFWEALTQILRAGRAKPFIQGGVIRFARDQAATVPVAMFTMRNITRGSFTTDYVLPDENRADALEVSFIEKDVWKPGPPLICALAGEGALRPAKVTFPGVIERAQNFREGMYEAASNRYRTRLHTFQTEMEGFILSPVDLIAISRDRTNWGTSGEVVNATGLNGAGGIDADGVLELSEPVTFTTGNHYIGLRRRDGSMAGPFRVTPGADDMHVVLWEPVDDFQPETDGTRERTYFCFGAGEAYRYLARVVGLRPRSDTVVEVACVAEDARVHTADEATLPARQPLFDLAKIPAGPVIAADTINIVESGSLDQVTISVSWAPAAGAQYYLLEISRDGDRWTRKADITTPHHEFVVSAGTLYLRVAGVGLTRGAWVSPAAAIDAGAGIAPPPDVEGLVLINDGGE